MEDYMIVQVDGYVKDRLYEKGSGHDVVDKAYSLKNISEALAGRIIKEVVVVPKKLINIKTTKQGAPSYVL